MGLGAVNVSECKRPVCMCAEGWSLATQRLGSLSVPRVVRSLRSKFLVYVWPPEFNTLILKGTWSIFQLFFSPLSLPSDPNHKISALEVFQDHFL